jgi:ABC-2 type transport system ATP-binding protein
MRQRLGIAAALIRRPKLLLLDEPATGLDPGGMRDMRALIARLSAEGMTVMLSSHLLAEVEELCNRVAIVRSGRIVYEGELEELRATAGLTIRLRTSDDEVALRVLSDRRGISDVTRHGAAPIQFRAADEAAIGELSRALADSGALIFELAPSAATLEDLFFELTEGEGDAQAEEKRLDELSDLTGGAQ